MIYYHDSTIPIGAGQIFDPTLPTSNGRTADTTTLINPVSYIAFVHGTLCDADSTQTITISAQAIEPATGEGLIIGSEFVSPVMIDASNEPDG